MIYYYYYVPGMRVLQLNHSLSSSTGVSTISKLRGEMQTLLPDEYEAYSDKYMKIQLLEHFCHQNILFVHNKGLVVFSTGETTSDDSCWQPDS